MLVIEYRTLCVLLHEKENRRKNEQGMNTPHVGRCEIILEAGSSQLTPSLALLTKFSFANFTVTNFICELYGDKIFICELYGDKMSFANFTVTTSRASEL